MDIEKEAAAIGIRLRSFKMGTQYTLCPFCSHKRKASNRKLKCMSVKIDADGLVYNCHHCTESGSFNHAKRKTRPGDRGSQPQRRTGGGYGSSQRSALARWVGSR